MKLNSEFILQEIGGDALLVPVGKSAEAFHGLIRLNETAAFLVKKLQKESSTEALIKALSEEYEGTAEQFEKSVETTLSKLREAGALIE